MVHSGMPAKHPVDLQATVLHDQAILSQIPGSSKKSRKPAKYPILSIFVCALEVGKCHVISEFLRRGGHSFGHIFHPHGRDKRLPYFSRTIAESSLEIMNPSENGSAGCPEFVTFVV